MKKTKKINIEATKFFYEENEKGLSKTKVSELFGVDRHCFEKLKDIYDDYIESARPEDNEYLFLFTEKEKEAIKEYNETNISKAALMKKYNIGNSKTLDNWLQICGLNTERHYKYNYDRRYFSKEPDEHIAYWAGFFLADGYVYENKNNTHSSCFVLGLGDKDKEHLKKLAMDLGFSEKDYYQTLKKDFGGAYNRKNVVWKLTISSYEFVEDLKKYNIVPKKSCKEIPYVFNDINLELAYIRGLIDGDGYISNPSTKQIRIGLVGSKEVCIYVKDFFEKNFNIKTNNVLVKQHSDSLDQDLYSWGISNREGIIIALENLYPKDCGIYLDRKFQNAQDVIAVLKSRN